MKITKFRLKHCLDPYLDYYVNIVFEYGDGNHGDETVPHYDEIYDIIGYDFEPADSEGSFPTLNLENVIMDNQGDWIELDY